MLDDLLIDPNSDEFEFFLIWLVEYRDFKAKEIIKKVKLHLEKKNQILYNRQNEV